MVQGVGGTANASDDQALAEKFEVSLKITVRDSCAKTVRSRHGQIPALPVRPAVLKKGDSGAHPSGSNMCANGRRSVGLVAGEVAVDGDGFHEAAQQRRPAGEDSGIG